MNKFFIECKELLLWIILVLVVPRGCSSKHMFPTHRSFRSLKAALRPSVHVLSSGLVSVVPQTSLTFWGLLSSLSVTLAAGHSCIQAYLGPSSGVALRTDLSPLDLSAYTHCCCGHIVPWPVKMCDRWWHRWPAGVCFLTQPYFCCMTRLGSRSSWDRPLRQTMSWEWKQARHQNGNPGLIGRWAQNHWSSSWSSQEAEVLIRNTLVGHVVESMRP